MNKAEILQQTQVLLTTTFIEFFQQLSCNIKQIDTPSNDITDSPAACIDVGSDELEIMVLLKIPMSVLALTYPSSDSIMGVSDEALEDWIAEMTNQLIGRFKNKMIQHDCHFHLGLPSSYFGVNCDSLLPENFQYAELFFNIDNEIIKCKLALDTLKEDVQFNRAANDDNNYDSGEIEFL